MDPEKIKAALAALKEGDGDAALAVLEAMLASLGGEPAAEPPPDAAMAETADPPPEEDPAAAAALIKLTGCASAGEAAKAWETMKARLDKLDADAAALDLSARRELVAELVKLGVEFPATAWEGKPEDRKPVKRLADEPLEDLRARVALHRKAKPVTLSREVEPPTRETGDVTKLSKREIDACKKAGITPEDYAERKANAVRRSA